MALDERSLPSSEHFTDLTCSTAYPGSRPSLNDPCSFYQNEFQWSGPHLVAHQVLAPPPHGSEPERPYYLTYPADRDPTPASQPYPTYGHHSLSPAGYYPPVHGLWSPDSCGDPRQSNPHHIFFSGVDLGTQSLSQPPSAGSSSSGGKPKRKRVQSHTQRKAANVRERRRMFHLNEAFDELRKRLPAFNYEKRLSRIETLRLAMTYISFMKEVSVGRDPKCIKLKPHGSELPVLGLGGGKLLGSPDGSSNTMTSHPGYASSENNDTNDVCDLASDSECSQDELSDHSGRAEGVLRN